MSHCLEIMGIKRNNLFKKILSIFCILVLITPCILKSLHDHKNEDITVCHEKSTHVHEKSLNHCDICYYYFLPIYDSKLRIVNLLHYTTYKKQTLDYTAIFHTPYYFLYKKLRAPPIS